MSEKDQVVEIRDLCDCGCGKEVNIFRGKPRRFVWGHNIRIDNPMQHPEIAIKVSQQRKGKSLPQSTKRKLSEINMGKVLSEEHKANISRALKGKKKPPFTKEHCKNIGNAQRGENNSNYGKPMSEQQKRKISAALKGKNHPFYGKHHTEERKASMSTKMRGKNHPFYGKSRSQETRLKISLGLRGEKSPNWKGGGLFLKRPFGFNDSLKLYIRKRDHFTCQLGGETEKDLRQALDVHHINYNRLNNSPTNLIALCHSCHGKTVHNREFWQIFFEGSNV